MDDAEVGGEGLGFLCIYYPCSCLFLGLEPVLQMAFMQQEKAVVVLSEFSN